MDDLSDQDDNYHESSDEDFRPTIQAADEGSSSDDDQHVPAKPTRAKGKRKAVADDELDSGDEATIEAARKRRRWEPKGVKPDDEGSDDDDDENEELLLLSDHDLIKTRAQRKVELKERKPLARIDGATVDVEALWAQMLNTPLQPISAPTAQDGNAPKPHDGAVKLDATQSAQEEEELVIVKKVYTFAGQLSEDEKQIPRSSLQQYLADGWKPTDATVDKKINRGKETELEEDDDEGPKVRRPLRRPLRFDSNPTGHVRTLPPEHQLSWPRNVAGAAPADQAATASAEVAKAARPEKAQRLNVVDKSRLDWTGFVDKEGIAEELDTHGKTKEAYLGRMDFLAGVEAKREEERKKMKTAAMAS